MKISIIHLASCALACFLLTIMSETASADVAWDASQDATSYAFVQFNDGTPGKEETDSTTEMMESSIEAEVVQISGVGVGGAVISADSKSILTESIITLVIAQEIQIYYVPGRIDKSGGTAHATLESDIDFKLPAKSVELLSRLNERRSSPPDASMTWNTTITNVSTDTLILSLASPTGGTLGRFTTSLISGNIGDSIRISTSASSIIEVPIAGVGDRQIVLGERELDLIFTSIPEPSTFLLALVGLMIVSESRQPVFRIS